MNKKMLAIMLALCLTLSLGLSACGGGDGGEGGGGGTAAGGKTLIIWDDSWEGIDLFQVSSWNDMQCLLADLEALSVPEIFQKFRRNQLLFIFSQPV